MNTGSLALVLSLTAASPFAQEASPGALDPRAPLFAAPDVEALVAGGMRDVVTRYRTDARTIERFFDVWLSANRRARRTEQAQSWLGALERLDFDALGVDDRIDYLLFRNKLRYELARFALDEERWQESLPLVPFADEVVALQEARRTLTPVDPEEAAKQLVALADAVRAVHERVRDGRRDQPADDALTPDAILANRVAGEVRGLRGALEGWFAYFDGYDPLFSWWCAQPYEVLDAALGDYARYLREEVAGIDEDDRERSSAIRSDATRSWRSSRASGSRTRPRS